VLTTEKGAAERARADVLAQLQRTDADAEDVKRELRRAKAENAALEKELRGAPGRVATLGGCVLTRGTANTNAEQKARLLEGRVNENLATIEQLRQERSLLAASHKDLQKQYAEASDVRSRLFARSCTCADGIGAAGGDEASRNAGDGPGVARRPARSARRAARRA
jgi:predicted nuclease with TOPRIM domain